MAAQARKCLELMEFKNKDTLLSAIAAPDPAVEIAKLRQQLLALSGAVDAEKGTSLVAALEREWAQQDAPLGEAADGGSSSLPVPSAVLRAPERGMSASMERSRQSARSAAKPRRS